MLHVTATSVICNTQPIQRASIDNLLSTHSLRILLWERELQQQESELKELRLKLKTREATLDQREKDLTGTKKDLMTLLYM